MDDFHPNAVNLPPCEIKIEAQRDLEDELSAAAAVNGSLGLAWTAIMTGIWIDVIARAGLFWLDPKAHTITRYGSGNQKLSVSWVETNGEAVVAVLKEPGRFKNKPFYVADHAFTTNELIDIAEEILPDVSTPWKVIDVPDVETIEQHGRRLWAENTQAGVVDRLHSEGYVTIILAALFNESNKYGTHFGNKLEPGWGRGHDHLKARLKDLVAEIA
jgi:hypothetical protein